MYIALESVGLLTSLKMQLESLKIYSSKYAMRALAIIVKIKFYRMLEINQKLATI